MSFVAPTLVVDPAGTQNGTLFVIWATGSWEHVIFVFLGPSPGDKQAEKEIKKMKDNYQKYGS